MNEYIETLLNDARKKEHWNLMNGDSRLRIQGQKRCDAIDEMLAYEAAVVGMAARIEELEDMIAQVTHGEFVEVLIGNDEPVG